MNRRDAVKALMAMPAVTTVSVAQLQPGDVILIEASGPISQDAVARIKAMAAELWPNNKCAVLGDGLKLKVVKALG